MKKYTYRIAAVAAFSVIAVVGFSKPWRPSQNPAIIVPKMNANFSQLPLKASLDGPKQPWSDTYWPHYEGGIAAPFRTGESAWRAKLPSKDEILSGKISAVAVNNLSPAAKFDLLRGLYKYPLTREVLGSTSPTNPTWWGICHGWAPAALNHPEPQPVTVTNPDGISIHFGSSDVKALISYYYADYAYSQRRVRQLGDRCNSEGFLFFRSRGCRRDLNAGAFHIALTNLIGLQHKGLVGDVTQGSEVWNQPISGYETKVLRERSVGSGKEVLVETRMDYVNESSPNERPVLGTDDQSFDAKNYIYWLDLDATGKITGGRFKQKSDESPDFFWTVEPMAFRGEFSALNQIYVPAK